MVGALDLMRADVEGGEDLTFSVLEHKEEQAAPALYEYRPLVERFVRDRFERICELKSSDDAAWAVASDPACNQWLRAGRADAVAQLEMVAREELLLPLLLTVCEAHPDFEFVDDTLLAQYMRFEKVLYSDHRRYAAVTPLWGVRLIYGDLELAEGVRIRSVDPELFRREWTEAAQLNWGEEGAVAGLPTTVLEFERIVEPDDASGVLDPLPAIDQVIATIRALAGGSVHAGPVVLERLDFRTLSPRPVRALAARRCGTVPSKIDGTVAKSLPTALQRLSSDPNGPVARALERYQFAATSGGMTALRAVYDTLVDIYADERETMSAALRMAVVVGAGIPERQQFVDAMREAALVIRAAAPPDDHVTELTRTLAAALRATIAASLVGELPIGRLQEYADGVLLGARERRRLGVAAMRPAMQPSS